MSGIVFRARKKRNLVAPSRHSLGETFEEAGIRTYRDFQRLTQTLQTYVGFTTTVQLRIELLLVSLMMWQSCMRLPNGPVNFNFRCPYSDSTGYLSQDASSSKSFITQPCPPDRSITSLQHPNSTTTHRRPIRRQLSRHRMRHLFYIRHNY